MPVVRRVASEEQQSLIRSCLKDKGSESANGTLGTAQEWSPTNAITTDRFEVDKICPPQPPIEELFSQ